MDDESRLPPLIRDFCIALREEIDAAKRSAASSAVALSNGRRIAQIGSSYQYAFSVDSILNLPDDSPGELIVPGQQRLDTLIVSKEGLSVTLSVSVDIGPFVPNGQLQTSLTFLMKKLVDRLTTYGDKPNPAGDRILGLSPPKGNPGVVEVTGDRPNPEQCSAIASSLGRDTTFIWGPPGTGKTDVIGEIGGRLFKCGRTLLVVSHTNTAVDGALKRIAENLSGLFVEGEILRVGEPKKGDIRAQEPELLLSKLAEKRSSKLCSRRNELLKEREAIHVQIKEVQRIIDLCEWVSVAESDIAQYSSRLTSLLDSESKAAQLTCSVEALERDREAWKAIESEANEIKEVESRILENQERLATLEHAASDIKSNIAKYKQQLSLNESVLQRSTEAEPLRQRLAQLPAQEIAETHLSRLLADSERFRMDYEKAQCELEQAINLYNKTVATGALVRLWRRLPSPEIQKSIVERLTAGLAIVQVEKAAADDSARSARVVVTEVNALCTALQSFIDVPCIEEQETAVRYVRTQLINGENGLRSINIESADVSARLAVLAGQVEAYESRTGKPARDNLQDVSAYNGELKRLRSELAGTQREIRRTHKLLESELRIKVHALTDWGFEGNEQGNVESMCEQIQQAYNRAHEIAQRNSLDILQNNRGGLNARVLEIDAEVALIEETLTHVEERFVSEAKIIATTLTRTYLRDTIQSRRFDTVILDEASMAPIPALWIAASLANINVVIVGDFKQLPPIVISEHPLAQEWLGKDIFEKSGIKDMYEQAQKGDRTSPPPHFVELRSQYRMHSHISEIPNKWIYDGTLKNGRTSEPSVGQDEDLKDWYNHKWGYDTPVLLVDTGRTGAWVTSVSRGGAASRLNFLSATLCVDIARRLLREEILKTPPQDPAPPKVLIICPYSPHARLLKLLVKEEGLSGFVEAGTAHSFQGSEAPIVIFDLVNDEPHWRVGMFFPGQDESTKRLLNVALTRAKRRLVIVGDFAYCERLSKKAFLGRDMIPYLRGRFKTVDALAAVPSGLATRAADAQRLVSGGNVDAAFDRMVVDQVDFYKYLLADIRSAQQSIIIYSPFITQNRVSLLSGELRAAVERGVRIYVITKTHEERGRNDISGYGYLEKTLSDWGVYVIHKLRMHEKIVFIDNDVIWSGSLNPLSQSASQEVMERRKSEAVARDYATVIRLNDLIAGYDDGSMTCPICGKEVVPAEGGDDPFYWRCVEDGCYTRSIDDPPLRDGVLTCNRCGGEVEFGEWGENPSWRCVKNRHHHQAFHRNHLRLPRMRLLIPEHVLRELDRISGVGESKAQSQDEGQLELF